MKNTKKIELAAVSKLLKNQGIATVESDFNLYPDEPADIVHIPTGEKFQVTQAQGEIGKLLNCGSIGFLHPADRTFEEFIEVPVKRKLLRYGGGSAVSDINLIIYDNIESPWLNNEVEKIKEDNEKLNFLKKCGFKAIYCVFNFQDTLGPIKIWGQ